MIAHEKLTGRNENHRDGRAARILAGDGAELETIAARALEKDRTRRYQSASELATDIRHYLRGKAIKAKADSRLYVLGKTLKRHRAARLSSSHFSPSGELLATCYSDGRRAVDGGF
jgi:hypothetical protein